MHTLGSKKEFSIKFLTEKLEKETGKRVVLKEATNSYTSKEVLKIVRQLIPIFSDAGAFSDKRADNKRRLKFEIFRKLSETQKQAIIKKLQDKFSNSNILNISIKDGMHSHSRPYLSIVLNEPTVSKKDVPEKIEDQKSEKDYNYYTKLIDRLWDLDNMKGNEERRANRRNEEFIFDQQEQIDQIEKELNKLGVMKGDQWLNPSKIKDKFKVKVLKYAENYF